MAKTEADAYKAFTDKMVDWAPVPPDKLGDDANRARIVKLRDEYEALWGDVIRRGVECGEFQIDDQKLFRLAVIQMVNGVAYWYRPTGERALPAIADEFAAFALAMAGCGEGEVVRAPGAATRSAKT